ncbi:hypothetical protein [Salmonirosea aquatica]|uniref:Uncharacterized protein n=1 Tax=Salmonirosea aquatica TaxID=2654236 RepID=A0A7C9B980_9BACT|nr:hypothetical protein [Cytophagaceae bacterium SJW1-29]
MQKNEGPKVDRQAVVVIHGIGEQRPMDTLRSFVKCILPNVSNAGNPAYFSKPDAFSDNYELRRLTVTEKKDNFKTDFYEFYWANSIQGTQVSDVWNWVRKLFLRRPGSIPRRLRSIYFSFWLAAITLIATLASTGIAIAAIWKDFIDGSLLNVSLGLLASAILAVFNGILVNYLGDAVRYMTPLPRNINERQQIRKAGIQLLRRLHETDQNGKNRYDRVVVVGHSLGSVIAYDLLNLFWCERNTGIPTISPDKMDLAESQATDLMGGSISTDQYRQGQFAFWAAQAPRKGSWRISDFITLGSPLAFAELYLAESELAFDEKKRQREFSTCPPEMEKNNAGQFFFSYPLKSDGQVRTLHHAAPFAFTRWTNIFFANDFVGGPIEGFGSGVENTRLAPQRLAWLPFFSHTRYWDELETESLSLIRARMEMRFAENPDL